MSTLTIGKHRIENRSIAVYKENCLLFPVPWMVEPETVSNTLEKVLIFWKSCRFITRSAVSPAFVLYVNNLEIEFIKKLRGCSMATSNFRFQIYHLPCRILGSFNINTFMYALNQGAYTSFSKQIFWKQIRMSLAFEDNWHKNAVFTKHDTYRPFVGHKSRENNALKF
jgi:hypothetical protein